MVLVMAIVVISSISAKIVSKSIIDLEATCKAARTQREQK
jgi:hypothetical protein